MKKISFGGTKRR